MKEKEYEAVPQAKFFWLIYYKGVVRLASVLQLNKKAVGDLLRLEKEDWKDIHVAGAHLEMPDIRDATESWLP